MSFFSSTPTWDFLIASSLLIIVIYSFIIGQPKTLKSLFAVYPAFFVADILGFLLPSFFPNLSIAFIKNDIVEETISISDQIDSLQFIIGVKVVVFLFFWIVFMKSEFFAVEAPNHSDKFGNALLFFALSFSYACLIMNIILLFLSGYGVFSLDPFTHILKEVMDNSFLSVLFVRYAGIWFAFPAFVLSLVPVLYHSEGGDE